jgi:hypothetical protein
MKYFLVMFFIPFCLLAEDIGEMWGTAEEESKYYKIVNIPIPGKTVVETGNFDFLPDGRLIIGTRYGDIYFVDGAFNKKPQAKFHKFATGLDEIFGVNYKDGAIYVTQSCEVTKITDTDKDGVADRYETINDSWGYGNYHEYAFGSKFDKEGNMYVALGLSFSYHSWQLYRGWALKITPDGKSTPWCSGLRSPGGVNENEHGVMFYAESQGPWNSSCSLKVLKKGGFMGHPRSYNWYKFTDYPKPIEPNPNTRIVTESKRVKELVPYSVIFPYIKMGRSISGFTVNKTKGKFGPFENQIFIGDYSLSLLMRATTEKVNGVWQGACYPFREGLSTGIMNIQFSPTGQLITGGSNRGWPVRGIKPYALERLDWTGKMPFEVKEIKITKDGFKIDFTKEVKQSLAVDPKNYQLQTYTHIYHGAYGGPEVDHTTPVVTSAEVSADKKTVFIKVKGRVKGHVHDFNLEKLGSNDGNKLLHKKAYYTLHEIPEN